MSTPPLTVVRISASPIVCFSVTPSTLVVSVSAIGKCTRTFAFLLTVATTPRLLPPRAGSTIAVLPSSIFFQVTPFSKATSAFGTILVGCAIVSTLSAIAFAVTARSSLVSTIRRVGVHMTTRISPSAMWLVLYIGSRFIFHSFSHEGPRRTLARPSRPKTGSYLLGHVGKFIRSCFFFLKSRVACVIENNFSLVLFHFVDQLLLIDVDSALIRLRGLLDTHVLQHGSHTQSHPIVIHTSTS
mmetsp:Transcript_35828/g.55725  ORF Transcript_35828/g.55725 Transcript_35828/m.55725 type:complete len:242 (-) Transcript_35828:1674-2399(-)